MTSQEYNKAIILLIRAIVMNNAGGVAAMLIRQGYKPVYPDRRGYIPSSELETALYQLYLSDKAKFFKDLNDLGWNYGEIETNKPEIKDELIKLASVENSSTSKSNWWQVVLGILAGQSTQQQAPQVTTTTSPNKSALIALAFVGIGVIVGAIFLIRSL